MLPNYILFSSIIRIIVLSMDNFWNICPIYVVKMIYNIVLLCLTSQPCIQ